MTADSFGSGTVENGSHRTGDRRLTLSRTDHEGGLLGALGATEVRAGDQIGLAHPLVTHGRGGRGFGFGRVRNRLGSHFDATTLDVHMEWERRESLTATFGLAYDLETHVGRIRAGLEWQARKQVLTMSLDAGSDGAISLQVGTRFSLRHDALAQQYRARTDASARQGLVTTRVFLDGNGNGTFDAGDEALLNIAFDLDGGRHPVTTDDQGLAHLAIGAHRRTSLAVAEGSLEDPYWLSTRPGVDVLTRPGRTEWVAFPIVATGEIDGAVYLVRGAGKVEVGGVTLELIDAEGIIVASVESQYDGFYLFEKILPGSYRLRIASTAVARWDLERLEPVDLVVEVGRVHSGVDFHVELPGSTSGETLRH